MADGTQQELLDHLHEAHQKGTEGLTEEFLTNLHKTLHEPDRDLAPEHEHIRDEEPGAGDETGAARDDEAAPGHG
jgi:hypothetical protein